MLWLTSCQTASPGEGDGKTGSDLVVGPSDSLTDLGDLPGDLGTKELPGAEDGADHWDALEDLGSGDLAPGDAEGDLAPQDSLPQDTMPEPQGTYPIFQKYPQGFFDRPFPSNTRLTADGLEVSDWPNPYKAKLIDQYKAVLAHGGRGFSCNPVMYVKFSGPLNLDSLPSPEASLSDTSPVQLVNLTPGSPDLGRRYPLEFLFWDAKPPKANWYSDQNVLAIRLPSGLVLPPLGTFGLFVFDTLEDAQGQPLQRPWLLSRLLEEATLGEDDQGLLDTLKPGLDYLSADDRAALVALTVFSTGDPSADLLQVAKTIREEAQPLAGEAPALTKTYSTYTLYEGSYRAANFQAGEIPYSSGGNFEFGLDSKPVVQRLEEIPYALSVPKGTPPTEGWPLVLISHGTGGSRYSFTYNSAQDLAAVGLAAMAIDQPLHGGRVDEPVANLELYSFNFTNPDSGRWLFRQGAADAVSQSVAVTAFLADEWAAKGVPIDASRLGFFGHSQGGLTGALFQGVDDSMQAVVLSGAGGLLSDTLMLRKELDAGTDFDIQKMMALLLGIKNAADLSVFHTVVSLMQAVVDPTDPINYSPLYFRGPGLAHASCVLQVQGMQDPYTPLLTAESLAAAGGWPVLSPPGTSNQAFEWQGIPEGVPPLEGNLDALASPPASGALAVFPDEGHFPAFDNQDCIALWTGVLKARLSQGRCLIDP
jgi:predicted esterase